MTRIYNFNDDVHVVAPTKAAAVALWKSQFEGEFTCKVVPKDEELTIQFNPYTWDDVDETLTAAEWADHEIWEEGPKTGAWFLETPEQVETKSEPEEESEKEPVEEPQVALRRKCVCHEKPSNSCPLCGGEGTVTVWVDAAWENEDAYGAGDISLTIKQSVVKDAFAHLEAYRVLTEKGFTVTKRLA